MKQAIKAGSYMPVRCMTNITKPKEFQFATDTRVKEHTMHTRSDSQKPFENQLRKHPPSPPVTYYFFTIYSYVFTAPNSGGNKIILLCSVI